MRRATNGDRRHLLVVALKLSLPLSHHTHTHTPTRIGAMHSPSRSQDTKTEFGSNRAPAQ